MLNRSASKYHALIITGGTILAAILLFSLLTPLFFSMAPSDYSTNILAKPCKVHPLGTNDIGQDILARFVRGARNTMIIAVIVGAVSAILSAVIGGFAALIGGLFDRIILRFVDVMLSIPVIVVILLIASFIRPGMGSLILILCLFGWHGTVRVVRAGVLIEKKRHFVSAARTSGAGIFYIAFRHIIPDILPIIVMVFIQNARRAVYMEAGLAFLGIANPQMISWGKMMSYALKYIYLDVWKWWLMPPVFALSLVLLGFSFIGYAIELETNTALQEGNGI